MLTFCGSNSANRQVQAEGVSVAPQLEHPALFNEMIAFRKPPTLLDRTIHAQSVVVLLETFEP